MLSFSFLASGQGWQAGQVCLKSGQGSLTEGEGQWWASECLNVARGWPCCLMMRKSYLALHGVMNKQHILHDNQIYPKVALRTSVSSLGTVGFTKQNLCDFQCSLVQLPQLLNLLKSRVHLALDFIFKRMGKVVKWD